MASEIDPSAEANLRRVYVAGAQFAAQKEQFCSNIVKTSIYEWWNFPFKNLFIQFHKLANWYFLGLTSLQMVPSVTISNGVPTYAAPLAFVLFISAVKDAVEDYRRHVANGIENNKLVDVRNQDGQFEQKRWCDVVVGDIVKLKNRESVPADIFLLETSSNDNLAYVMTANLDGETNLKQRKVVDNLYKDGEQYKAVNGKLVCDAPNKFLHSFTGTFYPDSGGQAVPLSAKNIMLRGVQVRNTEWVIGSVIYTGAETKIMKNSASPPAKMSQMSIKGFRWLIIVFLFQLMYCAIGSTLYLIQMGDSRVRSMTYLWGTNSTIRGGFGSWIERFFSFFLIFSGFVPISLIVTMDVVKFIQAFFMNQDLAFYSERLDRRLQVRCSELNEELGQIDHIFSDKTGTLTANIMDFRKCVINGKAYGEGYTQVQRNTWFLQGKTDIPEEKTMPGGAKPHVNFVGVDFESLVAQVHTKIPKCEEETVLDFGAMDAEEARINEFMVSLALNHDVMPENDKGKLIYSASSPDEGALVCAARHFGYKFVTRSPEFVNIETRNGSTYKVRLLQILPFSSKRKRSSVIVQKNQTTCVLYCKGADNVILERLNETSRNSKETVETIRLVNEMAKDGLRTLMLSKVEFPMDQYNEWAKRYHEAEILIGKERKLKKQELAAELEKDMTIQGATAIEDKLQDEVCDTIQSIRQAGVKVWMLTGDKVSTAQEIGYACGLWSGSVEENIARIVAADEKNPMQTEDGKEGGRPKKEDVKKAIDRALAEIQKQKSSFGDQTLVLDTGAVWGIVDHGYVTQLLEICSMCTSVICARVSPDQKRQIVNAVRENNPTIVTLSIGDGANDVPMIQRAHVGVGIYGEEGLQAVNNSDYAIAQFRHLKRLLFVHGRWSNMRMGILFVYMLYKNACLALPSFFFNLFNLASGQPLFLDFPLYLPNAVIFTFLPIFVFGVMEQDVADEHAMILPLLYTDGRTQKFFNFKKFLVWQFQAVFDSCILAMFGIAACAMVNGGVTAANGKNDDFWFLGLVVNHGLVWLQNLRLCLEVKSFTWPFVIIIALSLMSWYVFVAWFSSSKTLSNFVGMSKAIGLATSLSSPHVWLVPVLSIVTCMLPPLILKFYHDLFTPSASDICMELQKYDPQNANRRILEALQKQKEGKTPNQENFEPVVVEKKA